MHPPLNLTCGVPGFGTGIDLRLALFLGLMNIECSLLALLSTVHFLVYYRPLYDSDWLPHLLNCHSFMVLFLYPRLRVIRNPFLAARPYKRGWGGDQGKPSSLHRVEQSYDNPIFSHRILSRTSSTEPPPPRKEKQARIDGFFRGTSLYFQPT
jgi:hypothetical protein